MKNERGKTEENEWESSLKEQINDLVSDQEQNKDCSATTPSGGVKFGRTHLESFWLYESPNLVQENDQDRLCWRLTGYLKWLGLSS